MRRNFRNILKKGREVIAKRFEFTLDDILFNGLISNLTEKERRIKSVIENGSIRSFNIYLNPSKKEVNIEEILRTLKRMRFEEALGKPDYARPTRDGFQVSYKKGEAEYHLRFHQ